jgi:Domain of Unknown Function (DUF1080)
LQGLQQQQPLQGLQQQQPLQGLQQQQPLQGLQQQQPLQGLQQPTTPITPQASNTNPFNSAISTANYDNFESGTYGLTDGRISPNGKWQDIYSGYGSMGVARTRTSGTTNNYFFEQPKTSTSPFETHASLATTTPSTHVGDFKMTVQMKTVKQLRQNSAPNPWETGWIFWHMTDNFHYYALVLKTNGFQLEKKDNNNQNDAGEIYLITSPDPKVKIGQWQTITIQHENSSSGTPHIQVWVDGAKAADFIDNKSQPNSPVMSSGSIGLYNEDSSVNFDNVSINSIP